jgi:hypothetical protein
MSKPKKDRQVWLLEEGAYFSDGGLVVLASETKKAIVRWVKEHYPAFKRCRAQERSCEMFWQNNESRTWLRLAGWYSCPLLLK